MESPDLIGAFFLSFRKTDVPASPDSSGNPFLGLPGVFDGKYNPEKDCSG